MDYINDIYARLQNGEAVEDIAADLTKSINEAQAKFQAEASKREEEAKIHATRIDCLKNFVGAIADLLKCWDIDYPEVLEPFESMSDKDYDDLVGQIDAMVPLIKKYPELITMGTVLPKVEHSAPVPKPEAPKVSNMTIDPIDEFLNQFIRNR